LQPAMRNVVEVLGIGIALLTGRPGGFDVCEVLSTLIFATALGHPVVLAPDAIRRAPSARIEVADEASSPEARRSFAEFEE